jgi:hypothetical protein
MQLEDILNKSINSAKMQEVLEKIILKAYDFLIVNLIAAL